MSWVQQLLRRHGLGVKFIKEFLRNHSSKLTMQRLLKKGGNQNSRQMKNSCNNLEEFNWPCQKNFKLVWDSFTRGISQRMDKLYVLSIFSTGILSKSDFKRGCVIWLAIEQFSMNFSPISSLLKIYFHLLMLIHWFRPRLGYSGRMWRERNRAEPPPSPPFRTPGIPQLSQKEVRLHILEKYYNWYFEHCRIFPLAMLYLFVCLKILKKSNKIRIK